MTSTISQPNIKKNFIYSTAYQVFNVLTPFITAPYLSRVLRAEGIGIQSYTSSIQSYFLLLAALGTMTYGAREISINRHDAYKRSKLFWEIELMTVATSMMALALWIALICFSKTYRIYYIILTTGIFASLFDITWFFNGIEEFRLTVLRNVFFKIIGIISLFAFIKDKEDLVLYILISSVTTLLSSISLWPYLRRYLVKVNWRELQFKKHFRETLIYFIPTIATSVYTVLDKTLIGLITHSTAENGYYQQAERIINIAKSVVFTAINSVVGVRISFLYANKKLEEIKERIEYSFNYIFFTGFACCFGIIGIAKTFVPLFFGPGYEKVTSLLYVMSPIIVIIGISNCLGSHYYTPCGKRAQSSQYIICGSVTNLILNLILIPRLGSIGAAVASIAAELVVTALYIKNSGEYGEPIVLVKSGYKKMISGILMCVTVFFMNKMHTVPIITILLQIAAGAFVYTLGLLVLRDKWSLNIIKRVLLRILRKT